MKVSYDPRTDILTIILREDVQVAESDEGKPGIILDYDEAENLVSLEVLDASKRIGRINKVEFELLQASAG